MSTHNICFGREIRKILCEYPLLYVALWLYFVRLLIILRCIICTKCYHLFLGATSRIVLKPAARSSLYVIALIFSLFISFFPSAVRAWNSLSKEIRVANTVASFK